MSPTAAARTSQPAAPLLRDRLKGTSIVSIAHRPGVAGYHDRKLTLVPDGDKVALAAG